jgi:hypothetical protein
VKKAKAKAATRLKKRTPTIHIIGEQTIVRPTPLTERLLEAVQVGIEAGAKLPKKRFFDDARALELQDKLEAYLRTLPAKPKKQSKLVPWVEEQIRAKGLPVPQDGGLKIEREIIRPVYQRLGWAKARK